MHRSLVSSLLLCTLLVAGCDRSTVADRSFADKVADQLRGQLPGYQVTVVDKLTLKVSGPSKSSELPMQINLDRVADYCERVPDGCDSMISGFISKSVEMVKEIDLKPNVSDLRAVLRPTDYLGQLNELMAKKGDVVVSAPFAGDIAMICYFDQPTSMSATLKSDLPKIGLSQDRALQVCLDNMRTNLPRLADAPQVSAASKNGGFNYLEGDPYESTYLLLHDEWAPLAMKLGGHLLVAAPDADLIVFGQDAGKVSSDALSLLAKEAFRKAERPISQEVFRWTPSGWEAVAN
jgi:uncharacterized protein YtpQ (UPF0354 family)